MFPWLDLQFVHPRAGEYENGHPIHALRICLPRPQARQTYSLLHRLPVRMTLIARSAELLLPVLYDDFRHQCSEAVFEELHALILAEQKDKFVSISHGQYLKKIKKFGTQMHTAKTLIDYIDSLIPASYKHGPTPQSLPALPSAHIASTLVHALDQALPPSPAKQKKEPTMPVEGHPSPLPKTPTTRTQRSPARLAKPKLPPNNQGKTVTRFSIGE
jgi:hypothetical protein